MPRPLKRAALLLFASGACSLTYETVWLRDLRLIFGASTMASAAVVACFVGGLGAGALVFGRRADRAKSPLAMYATLEAGISLSAALSPLLMILVRTAYVAIGGSRVLGPTGGTVARLILASLVFTVPTLLMGGTLPAVARAVESDSDEGRRNVALLYGVNTLGAVAGCLASTFVFFEVFGTHLTLWMACLVNALVAMVARSVARALPEVDVAAKGASSAAGRDPERPAPWLILVAAGVSGFVFCLMELVWYRMLGPLLGGSVFTFGLILAVALGGIGVGGLVYGLRPQRAAATLQGFAWTCVLEAAFVAVPYALGDRLAVLAALLQPVGDLSFGLRVAGWGTIALVVVLPASLVCGVQFPLLIGLLGQGGRDVGRDVGRVYATNTIGPIAGSIAGGFGLIATLTAPGCWRVAAASLLAVGIVVIVMNARRHPLRSVGPALAAALGALLLSSEGPTAAWRHSPIGVGRVDASALRTPNAVTAWEHDRRRAIEWQVDGRESAVGLDKADGLAFIVNGKNDGAARGDAGTSIMAGMLGALLHPHPTRALVIGLGTGETAGWLAAVPSITDVDVDELEPAMLEVARRTTPLNHDVLGNGKVHIELGDARELLLTSRERYSVVMSEPSNPYRAGIASLFTQSYYEAIRDRLQDDGLFLQWVQGYDVDARTVRTVYATLVSVFPEVETWELTNSDLLLVASKAPIEHDLARMTSRLREEPFSSASASAWRATDLESFLGHFVATSGLARRVAEEGHWEVNTDDLNLVEFGFAHAVGAGVARFSIEDVRRAARARGEDRIPFAAGGVDWDAVAEARVAAKVAEETLGPEGGPQTPAARARRVAALHAFDQGDLRGMVAEWHAQTEEPTGLSEMAFLGVALADGGDAAARAYADRLRGVQPCEADAILARMYLRQGSLDEATRALESAFERLRVDPWPMDRLIRGAFADALEVSFRDGRFAARLLAALREPFVIRLFDSRRQDAAFTVSLRTQGPACVSTAEAFGPDVPWNGGFLRARYECFRANHAAGLGAAESDLLAFLANAPPEFGAGL